MKKYLSMIILVLGQGLTSLVLFRGFDPSIFFALWAFAYLSTLFRAVFQMEPMTYGGFFTPGGKDDSWKHSLLEAEVNLNNQNLQEKLIVNNRIIKIVLYTVMLLFNVIMVLGFLYWF